jgi:selenocysteine-specific elongation factor
LQDGATLAPGDAAVSELRLTKPLLAFTGDRIVIRDSADRRTLAGAVVLDPTASARNFRKPAQREFFRDCSVMPLTSTRLVRAQLKRDHAVVRSSVLKNSWFSTGEISESLRTLASEKEIALRGEFAIDAPWWRAAISKAVTMVDAEHKTHPDRVGLNLMRLRKMLALDSQQVFDALLADLAMEGIARVGDVVRRSSHHASLPPALQEIANDIRTALAVKSFDPPSRRELTTTAEAKQALRFLIQSNEVLEINEEVVLLRDAFFQMRDTIVSLIRKNGAATVAELRQTLSSSRRVMVPLLEYLDRNRVTRRIGDRRTLAG